MMVGWLEDDPFPIEKVTLKRGELLNFRWVLLVCVCVFLWGRKVAVVHKGLIFDFVV